MLTGRAQSIEHLADECGVQIMLHGRCTLMHIQAHHCPPAGVTAYPERVPGKRPQVAWKRSTARSRM